MSLVKYWGAEFFEFALAVKLNFENKEELGDWLSISRSIFDRFGSIKKSLVPRADFYQQASGENRPGYHLILAVSSVYVISIF